MLEPPYRLIEAVLTSTHNLCLRAKIRTEYHVYPCKPQFYRIKVGFKESTLHVHDSMMQPQVCGIKVINLRTHKNVVIVFNFSKVA